MKQILFIFILGILVSGCKKFDPASIQNLNGNEVLVIGHGGVGFPNLQNPTPANSLKSIQMAVDGYNADAVDVDIQLTKDHKIVLYHDDKLESQTNCVGCVSSMDAEEIIGCKYRTDFSNNITENESVQLLESVFAIYSSQVVPKYFLLDTKLTLQCASEFSLDLNTFADAIYEAILDNNMEERVLVNSISLELLQRLKDLNGDLLLFKEGRNFDEVLSNSIDNNFMGMLFRANDITEQEILNAHAAGKWVILFTVSDRAGLLDALQKSPDGIITDNIPMLQNFLR